MLIGQVSRGQPGTLLFLVKSRSRRDNSSDDDDSSKSGKSSGDDKSGNDNSQTKSGSSKTSSSSSSQASSTGTSQPLPPPPSPPCVLQCVPDNDPRVFYSPAWSVSPRPFFRTSHETDVVGSWLSFAFNGSEITVYGSVPSSNTTHTPPTAAYAIDAAKPFVTAEPMARESIPNQPLFSASQLSRDLHTLVINVTDVQTGSPFAIDHFIVTPSPPEVSAIAIPSLPVNSSSGKAQPSKATVGIVAGVLGSVIFILLCLAAFFFVILRRRRQRAHRSKSFQSSLFTRSESILVWNDWGGSAPSAYSSTSGPLRSKVGSAIVPDKWRNAS